MYPSKTKVIIVFTSVILSIFCNLSLLAQERYTYLGVWKTTDEKGNTFLIQVNPDYTVETTYSGSLGTGPSEVGLWKFNQDRLAIVYNNGHVDILSRTEDGRFIKTSFAPEKSISRENGVSAPATKTDEEHIWKQHDKSEFVGVWELKDEKSETFHLRLKPDLSAQSTYAGGTHGLFGEHGTWRLERNRVTVLYDSGWVDVITLKGDGAHKASYEPGQRLFTKPQNHSQAKKIDEGKVGIKGD